MPAYVRVPYLMGLQKPLFTRIITRRLRKVPCTSWERQALRSRIFIVRTVPHTVRSVFEMHSNQSERLDSAPPCCCDESHCHLWESAGQVLCIRVILLGFLYVCNTVIFVCVPKIF